MKLTINKFLVIFIFIPFLFITAIYASFSSELMIDGIAHLRPPADIRITNLRVVEQTNGAYEVYSSEFNKDTTSMYASLPNIDSTIVYEVTIKNSSTISYDLSNLIIESNSNDNVNYEMDIDVGEEILANSEKNFTIKLYYNSESLPSDTSNTLVVRYEFLEHINSYVVATYGYVGLTETFVVPYNGVYKIELWGASGGYGLHHGVYEHEPGLGGYTSGEIELFENEELFINVGGVGGSPIDGEKGGEAGYNGGGVGGDDNNVAESRNEPGGGGGGATDIRIVSGKWNNSASLASRIMVAAGGGGSAFSGNGGSAGGLVGFPGNDATVLGATQTTGSAFGIGAAGLAFSGGTGGGGGGYYGGNTGEIKDLSGSGGSSYISGFVGCVAISDYDNISPKFGCVDGTTDVTCSYHYSNKIFLVPIIIDGESRMPTFDNLDTKIGNSGNGYAKITFIRRIYK